MPACKCGCGQMTDLPKGWVRYHHLIGNRNGQVFGREWNSTPKATMSPTMGDIRQAAGFIEGEGSFSSYTSGKTKWRNQQIQAVQVNREPLDFLQSIFGGIIAWRPKGGKNGIHVWRASGSRARGIMMTLYSFMSARRKEQIRAALKEV